MGRWTLSYGTWTVVSVFYGIVPRGIKSSYVGRERRGEIPQLNKLGKYWVEQSTVNANIQE